MIDTSSSMLYHISNLNDESHRISYQMATGKNMEKGSENSLLHKDLIDLDDKLRVTKGLKLQLDKTKAMNDTSDTNVGDVKKSVEAIKLDLMKALNDGLDRSDKQALSTNIKGIRETIFDRMNTQIDSEYIFAGSFPEKQTMVKDADFDLNGKVDFGGDSFLREIAVQPGSYRDRGVTAYDVAFYNSDSANPGDVLSFEEGESIIDDNGNEWKLNDSKNRLQKYDYNGVIIEPLEEIKVKTAASEKISLNLGLGTNTDALGDYSVKITDEAGVEHLYSYTATGDSTTVAPPGTYTTSAEEIFNHPNGLIAQIKADFPNSIGSASGDTLTIDVEGDAKIKVEVFDTDRKYNLKAENKIEADTTHQGQQNKFEATIPYSYEGSAFEAKHNYFDDLNKVINALDGYTTKLDGTRGSKADDDLVDDITRTVLDQTKQQFDATNVGHGELGGRNKVFEVAYDKIETQETHYDLLILEWGSANKTKLALESKALDLTYQSLYSTISKMNSMSLVNFLK